MAVGQHPACHRARHYRDTADSPPAYSYWSSSSFLSYSSVAFSEASKSPRLTRTVCWSMRELRVPCPCICIDASFSRSSIVNRQSSITSSSSRLFTTHRLFLEVWSRKLTYQPDLLDYRCTSRSPRRHYYHTSSRSSLPRSTTSDRPKAHRYRIPSRSGYSMFRQDGYTHSQQAQSERAVRRTGCRSELVHGCRCVG